jgi:hypothetical protein
VLDCLPSADSLAADLREEVIARMLVDGSTIDAASVAAVLARARRSRE